VSSSSEDAASFFEVMGHKIRIDIILLLKEKQRSYSEIQKILGIERGKLNFHLKKLSPFIKVESGHYSLSENGLKAYKMLKEFKLLSPTLKTPNAPFWKRAIAWFIDVFVLYFFIFGIRELFSFYEITFFNITLQLPSFLVEFVFFNTLFLVGFIEYSLADILKRIAFLMIMFGYWALFEGYNGKSLGKYILKIKIRKITGRNITPYEAAIRSFAKSFFLPLDIIAGLIVTKLRRIRLSAYITETIVIEEGNINGSGS